MKGLIVSLFGLLAAFVIIVIVVIVDTIAVVDGSSLRVASTPMLINQHDESSSRYLQKFQDIGTKNPTRTLGLCKGDCDSDSDCSGDLICYQRSAGQSIPGCSGIPNSNSDFCIRDPSSNGDDDDNNGDDDNNNDDNGGGGGESFALKLYWERGKYFTQSLS